MQQKKVFFPVFVVFFILALSLFLLSRVGVLNGITGFFENTTVPFAKSVFNITKGDEQEITKIREENARLVSVVVKFKELERENQSLRDQLRVSSPNPQKLLPAELIGVRNEQIILDKGEEDGIKKGAVVVHKDNLVGKVVTVSQKASVVDLLRKKTTLTAKTLKTQSSGVLRAMGGNMILDNVTLSEKLERGDFVITKGDIAGENDGYPPDLVIGRIKSVNKRPSSLFQTAEVENLVDVSKVETVFVIIE